jgi:hypothetical protein
MLSVFKSNDEVNSQKKLNLKKAIFATSKQGGPQDHAVPAEHLIGWFRVQRKDKKPDQWRVKSWTNDRCRSEHRSFKCMHDNRGC